MADPRKAEMMVWTWAGWEPLQYYRRLGGYHESQEGNALWSREWSAKLRSEETAKALADAGINWVTTHFFKGFGLEVEAEEIADTVEMIENFHKYGVKVFTYIQYGTIVPETILDESADGAPWSRTDWHGQHDGHPYEYGEQYWRDKPCANQPGFREYMLKCVDKAVEIGADGIWVDNLQADGCHCPHCQKAFQNYLREHVSDPWEELGVRNIARIAIPRAERPKDPVFQAWVRFRCEETKTSIRMIADHAREVKPGIIVAANMGLGCNICYSVENGNWLSSLDVLDYCYAENGLLAGMKDGRLVSQHFPMKIANALGFKIVPGAGFGTSNGIYPQSAVPRERLLKRLFAESAALGAHTAGGPFGLRGETGGADMIILRDEDYRQRSRGLRDAYSRWWEMFDASTDAAPVAVLYDFEAMSFDDARSREAFESISQLLLTNQIPFKYVLQDKLESLDGVKLLIMPHVLPVSDAVAAELAAYVSLGGKILATGRTSLYDEGMRMRYDYALAEVFGVSFADDFERANHDGVIINPKNGCILLPGEWGIKAYDGGQVCGIPGGRLLQLIRDAVPASSLPEVISPLPQVMFETRALPDGRRLLCYVNYGDDPVRGIEVRLPGDGINAIMGFSTANGESKIEFRKLGDGRIAFTIPELDVDFFTVIGG